MGTAVRIADNLDVTMTGYSLTNGTNVETPKTGQEWVVTHWKFHNFRSSHTDAASSGFKTKLARSRVSVMTGGALARVYGRGSGTR